MMQRRSFIASTLATATAASLPRHGSAAAPAVKLFDTHAHFYANEPEKYPMNAGSARYGAERMLKKVAERPMTPEVVFAFWDQVGVEMGTGVQYNSVYGSDNSYLLDVCRAHPRRALPVVILPPTDPKTPGLLEKWAKDSHLAAVRWTGGSAANGYPYLSDAAKDAWAVCNALGLAVVLMPLGNTAPALQQIAKFADAYPNVRIAMDHIGFPRPELLPDTFGLTPAHHELAKHRNVYYKLTNFLVSEMEAGAKGANRPMVALPGAHGRRVRRRSPVLGLGLWQRRSRRRAVHEEHDRGRIGTAGAGALRVLLRHRQGGIRGGRPRAATRLNQPVTVPRTRRCVRHCRAGTARARWHRAARPRHARA
jgi:predicted TIM-barrel fold metal-dependent hydrolase